ncbi:MAG: GNAT family N-acetyltransferase [Elainella sp. Prado103]|jgi:ribosomal protein S18 acetylase RimI-like enzyme|nr:GNAT family N-acetyltransferase [Elainella sp. Prado103]
MDPDEIHLAIDWAASEGWNPGLYDANSFYAADPQGFWIGELGSIPIATISAVRYGASFGFIGFYIVQPDYRGQGYGLQLWQAAMQALSGRNVGLDGVVAQQNNYQKSGFKLAYRNLRYQGVSGGDCPTDPTLVDIAQLPFEQVAAYDRSFFPDDRSTFLQSWLQQPERVACGVIHNSELVGYGMIRPCRTGYKIGPLFADRPAWAELLLTALRSQVPPAQPIYLDVPESNPAAVALAEAEQMSLMFETARMYTGDLPDLPLDRLFGVTTFELG